MGVVAGSLLNEANLYTNGPLLSRDSYSTGNTSSTKQVVIVAPCLIFLVDNQAWADNHLKCSIYRANITAGGGLSGWTAVVTNRDMNDARHSYSANVDNASVGADYDLTAGGVQPYAIAWKIVTNPYDPGFWSDDRSRCTIWWGGAGLQKAQHWESVSSPYYDSKCDWATYYQGHQMLILNGGFRKAHSGSYRSDSPENYVTFLQDTQIAAGHTVVFAP
jgi:hypothetical protein